MVLFTLLLGFLVGALTIIAAEVVAVVLVLRQLNRRETNAAPPQSAGGVSDLHDSFLPVSCSNKQGVVWVLEPEKVPKSWHMDKVPKEQKRKKEIFEVAPVRKFAKVKDQSLILRESDGSRREIQLKGCSIAAVSATSLSSRKWARKYPIKVESKTSILYNGSKTLYIYLETSWEKESWCKALRHASCNDKEKLNWYSKLHLEFQSYLTILTTGYPSFMKPSVGFNAEPVDRSVKLDGSSKVRHFLKKLAKKATKSGVENKTSWTLTPGSEEGKINEKYHSFQDSGFGTGVVKPTSIWEAANLSMEDKMGPSPSTLPHSGSRSHSSVISDADSDERIGSDEGTLCWNLLTSRLFFDAKSNTKIKSFIQARIQRTLSNMRKPGYIGELSCTGIDLGNLPPCINAMRLLPSDMNEVWALEIDIVYSGGAVLDIETRLEVRELDFEESMVDGNLESSSSMEGMASDLLEGFEYFEKQLELSDGAEGATKRIDETDSKQDGMKNYKTTKTAASSASRWKSILNSVAKQVSQVPLSLAIRVTSLKGTLRLHIKPPPSDQLWFGFTSMPDIDFNLESSVGEHKINSGRIALFLINRFKAVIRETLVLPNCESVCIPWMLAEKDDWIPQEVAPFLWIKQEAAVVRERPSSQPGEVVTPITSASGETTSDFPVFGNVKGSKVESFDRRSSESSGSHALSSEPAIKSNLRSKSVQELTTPLLSNDEPQAACESRKEENPECQSLPRSLILTGEQIQVTEGDDVRPKKMGTRARMLGLGKKMGEKLEEKKRHIEEKGRIIVDKMRGP